MNKLAMVLIGFILPALTAAGQTPAKPEDNNIKVTISSVSPMLGPPTTRYHVGEQIPVTIQLTNTSKADVYTCISGDLYQDHPTLSKDGQSLPYMSWQSYLMQTAEKDRTCINEGLPDLVLLRPNEPVVVDYLMVADDEVLPTGSIAWYDKLTPGKYQLSVQRRFACCDGPTAASNTISFEIVQ